MTESDGVNIGDRLAFSVELIETIRNDARVGELVIVRLREIRVNPDGTKLLVLERDAPAGGSC